MSSPSARSPHPRGPPACKRCSVNKKKCDRLAPRCTGCVAADVPCEPMIKSSDKRLMRQLEEIRHESNELKRQLTELRQQVQRTNTTGYQTLSHQAPHAIPALSLGLPSSFLRSNEHPILSPNIRHTCSLHYVFTAFDLQDVDCSGGPERASLQNWISSHQMSLGSTIIDHLPSMNEIRRTIQSLVESTKHGPSNLDKIISLCQLQEDCRAVYGPGGLDSPQHAASRFRCFVTVYLAMCMTGAADAEDVTANPRALACLSTGLKELTLMTEKEDFACVEALTLLSELAIHAPIGLNLWQLLGIATRTAVAINLHRQDDVYLPTVFGSSALHVPDSEEMSLHNQRRKDLFWALYSLDRLGGFVLNRPPSLADTDIDVDVPPAIMWPEGKYATLSSEALWVHHIQSRRLYGQIQGSLYGPSKSTQSDGESAAPDVVSGYMQQVQQWYMKSRFNSTVIPFSEESIKRHVLDDIQYHQMVMALHQPCDLIPDITSTAVATLYRSATLCVGLFHHSASRKQLNIHWVNLHQAFTSCAILIYCLRQHQIRSDLKSVSVSEDKVSSAIAQCREVISLFEGIGPVVQQYQRLFSILVDAFEAQRTNADTPSDTTHLSQDGDSSRGRSQGPPSGMDFDMDMSFSAAMFPGIAEGSLLDAPSNILSPTYWMDAGQVRLDQSTDGAGSVLSHVGDASVQSATLRRDTGPA